MIAHVPSPSGLAERLTTGLAVLDAQRRVAWLNDAMADLLEVGVRGLREQPIAVVLPTGSDMLSTAIRRLQAGEVAVTWRRVELTTLKRNSCLADVTLQALEPSRWLLEVHALAAAGAVPTPLWATLRGVAHEIRNPLTGLRGAAQLLVHGTHAEDTRRLAAMIIGEADRLDALTRRLLAQDQGAHVAAVTVHALLGRVRALSAKQGVAIEVDYDPSLPDVTGDADRLQQALLNLVRNAMEAGATRLCLRTRIAHAAALAAGVVRTAVRVDVIDDGPGVPDALRENLFEPLVSGRAEGTGLGLALARETARDHGGDLRHARTAEGTVFSLYLPLDPPGNAGP